MTTAREISRHLTHVLSAAQRMIDTASVDAAGQIADVQERMRLDDLLNDAQVTLNEFRVAAYEPRVRTYAGMTRLTSIDEMPPLAG